MHQRTLDAEINAAEDDANTSKGCQSRKVVGRVANVPDHRIAAISSGSVNFPSPLESNSILAGTAAAKKGGGGRRREEEEEEVEAGIVLCGGSIRGKRAAQKNHKLAAIGHPAEAAAQRPRANQRGTHSRDIGVGLCLEGRGSIQRGMVSCSRWHVEQRKGRRKGRRRRKREGRILREHDGKNDEGKRATWRRSQDIKHPSGWIVVQRHGSGTRALKVLGQGRSGATVYHFAV
jgi:hypothetical protein